MKVWFEKTTLPTVFNRLGQNWGSLTKWKITCSAPPTLIKFIKKKTTTTTSESHVPVTNHASHPKREVASDFVRHCESRTDHSRWRLARKMTKRVQTREKMSPREGEAQQGEGKVSLLLSRTRRNMFTRGGRKKQKRKNGEDRTRTWHGVAVGGVVAVTVVQPIPEPADLNRVRGSNRLAGQSEGSASAYIHVLWLVDECWQTCTSNTVGLKKKLRGKKKRKLSRGWISPSTLTVIGCDSTTMWLTLSLQRYSPASDRCTFLILQSTGTPVTAGDPFCVAIVAARRCVTWQLKGGLWRHRWWSGGRWSHPACVFPDPGHSWSRWWCSRAWRQGCPWSSWMSSRGPPTVGWSPQWV